MEDGDCRCQFVKTTKLQRHNFKKCRAIDIKRSRARMDHFFASLNIGEYKSFLSRRNEIKKKSFPVK